MILQDKNMTIKNIVKNYIGLTSGISMIGLSLGCLLPLATLRLSQWTENNFLIGFVIAFYALGLILSTKLSEKETTKYGEYKTIKIYSFLIFLSTIILNYSHNYYWLSLGLLILGITSGVVFNVVETSVNDLLDDSQRGRWVAVHCTIFTLFQLIGPLLIENIQIYFPKNEFIICGLIFLIVFIPYFLLEKNKKQESEITEEVDKKSIKNYIIENPSLVFSTGLFSLFDTLVLSLIPVYCINEGLTPKMALISSSVLLLGDTFLEILFGVLADKFGRKKIHYLCAFLLIFTGMMLPLSINTFFWWINIFLLGGSAGGIYVLSMVETGIRFKGKSLLKMTSILGGVWGFFSLVGPLLVGLMMNYTNNLSIAILMIVLGVFLLFSFKLEEKNEKKF